VWIGYLLWTCLDCWKTRTIGARWVTNTCILMWLFILEFSSCVVNEFSFWVWIPTFNSCGIQVPLNGSWYIITRSWVFLLSGDVIVCKNQESKSCNVFIVDVNHNKLVFLSAGWLHVYAFSCIYCIPVVIYLVIEQLQFYCSNSSFVWLPFTENYYFLHSSVTGTDLLLAVEGCILFYFLCLQMFNCTHVGRWIVCIVIVL